MNAPRDWMLLEFHHYAAMFDMLPVDELQPIIDDMKEHGYDAALPITLFDGKVLDGRNRMAASIAAGVVPAFVQYEGRNPIAFVWRANEPRRHLTVSQRALAAGRRAKLSHGQHPDESCKFATLEESPETLEKTAKDARISKRTASDGKKVVDQGTPELQQAVADKTIAISDAAKVAGQPPEVQKQAVDAVRNGTARTAREAVNGEARGPKSQQADELGRAWPEAALPSVKQLGEMRQLCRMLDQCAEEARRLGDQPVGTHFDSNGVASGCERYKRAVLGAMPTHVCPYCAGKPSKKPCDACRGLGWVTRVMFKASPPEMQAQPGGGR